MVMKNLVLLNIILLSTAAASFGQDFKPWNVSLEISPFRRTVIAGVAVNRSFGKKVELGVMPIFHYANSAPPTNYYWQQTSLGVNLTGKYFIGRGNAMDPYVSGIFGYGTSKQEFRTNSSGKEDTFLNNYSNVVLRLGNEVKLGSNGWIFDFSVGLLWTKFYDSQSSSDILPIYSFGLKKKFKIK
jgi:hypothetical protein